MIEQMLSAEQNFKQIIGILWRRKKIKIDK